MRIVIVIGRLIHGGAETQFITLSKELVKRGHSVLMYTLRSDNSRLAELEGSGVDIAVDQKRHRFDPGLIWRLRKRLREYRADLVQGVLMEGNLYALLASAATGIPALVSERTDDYPVPVPYRIAIPMTRRLASAIVANTTAGGRYAQRLYGLPDQRIHVVQNASTIDPNRSRPVDVKEFFNSSNIKLVAVVGTIAPVKDQLLAVRAFEVLRSLDPRWRLLIVGGTATETAQYQQALLSEVHTRGLAEFVRFTGFRADSVSIIERADVVLSTSVYEGCPNVILEAMAVGTPVASTAYSDIRQILPMPWQVCDDRTPEGLANAVIQADQNRQEVIARQKSWISANAMPGQVTTELELVYKRYLSGKATWRPPTEHRVGSASKFAVVFVGTGIFPYRICGDKNFLLDLSDELNKREIETRFISIVNGPSKLPQASRFTYINRAFHSATERHVRRNADGRIVAYWHDHGLPRTWLEIAATLFFHRKTIALTLKEFENVVVHWMDSSLMVPVIKAACGPSARYVSTMFRYRATAGLAHQVRVQALSSADCIITGTEASRELLLADGCDSQSIVVAPWGCHSRETINGEGKTTRNLRILWSGFIQQIGREDFLRTVAIARRVRDARSDIDFVFSLKPECYSPDFALFNSTGIVVTSGSPSFFSELPQYDAFLSPVADYRSSSAPPLTWTEAMSAGLPIITTEHPGALEVLDGGNCGIVAGDYQDLERTLLDPGLATRLAGMRWSARERHRTHYDVEAIGERYASIYANLFAQPR